MTAKEVHALNLAYIGDAVYTLMVRKELVNQADYSVNVLSKMTAEIVSAAGQAEVMHALLEEDFLTEEELAQYHRGRNANVRSVPKHSDPVTYHVATGFEAFIGYVYWTKNEKRLEQIWDKIRTIWEEHHGTMGLREKHGE